MAKTATTKKVVKKSATKKAVKVVTPAKGKGKPAKVKVVSKKGAKVTVSKAVIDKRIAKANKPAVKKVKAPKIVDPNKYGKFTIEDCPNEKYTEMVIITNAPKAFDDLIGKKYVSRDRCIATLEVYIAEGTIAKGEKSIIKELDANGIVPMEPAVTDEEK